jgi:major membrane immunogen (membrane-anchored lipoprotein)
MKIILVATAIFGLLLLSGCSASSSTESRFNDATEVVNQWGAYIKEHDWQGCYGLLHLDSQATISAEDFATEMNDLMADVRVNSWKATDARQVNEWRYAETGQVYSDVVEMSLNAELVINGSKQKQTSIVHAVSVDGQYRLFYPDK